MSSTIRSFVEVRKDFMDAIVEFPLKQCSDLKIDGVVLIRSLTDPYESRIEKYFLITENSLYLPDLYPLGRYTLKAFMWCGSTLSGYINQDIYSGVGGEGYALISS